MAIVAALGFAGTFAVEATLAGGVAVQPVERDASSDTGWRFVGGVVRLDRVPSKGRVTGDYPGLPTQVEWSAVQSDPSFVRFRLLQQSVLFARYGAMGALIVCATGLIALRRFPWLTNRHLSSSV